MDSAEKDGKYRTSDLYYAAYLKVAGVPLLETTQENGGRVVFVFEHGDGLRDLRNQYFNRAAKVVALTYADEVRSLKALTHMADPR